MVFSLMYFPDALTYLHFRLLLFMCGHLFPNLFYLKRFTYIIRYENPVFHRDDLQNSQH